MVQATQKGAVVCFWLMSFAGLTALFCSWAGTAMPLQHETSLLTHRIVTVAGIVWLACLLLYLLLLLQGRRQTNTITRSPAHQLQALQDQCAFLLNSIDHGLVVIDLAYRVSFVNDACCQMFAKERSEMLGEAIDENARLRPDEAVSLTHRLLLQTQETGENQSKMMEYPQPDGGFSTIQLSTTLLRDHFGNAIGFLLHYQDRTAERELQESMRRNDQLETVSQMAASIAHEVRNPMTSVQGFLQLMSREIDPSHTHSMYLHVMEEDLKRINSIITEYLNFSRMGSDSLEDVWVGTLLHNTYTLLQSEANLKGIQLTLSLSGKDPLMIANGNRLKQVLINLARNAMEAMKDQGGGSLTLALETTAECIVLMVKDTGPGIPVGELDRIFKPFYTTKETGTGLGLFVCKKIIEEHNGTIRVQTEEGRGTIFSIYLPKNRLFEDD